MFQLVTYNKNLIKQYGTCYLKVKTSNRVHLHKFYIVNSRFNPIIGVASCHKLGLISFQSPVYTGWNDGQPVSIGVNAVDSDSQKTRKEGGVMRCGLNAKSMGEHTEMQTCDNSTIPSVLIKDWIINHPKYKHLFSGIGRFKCSPVTIEIKPYTGPIRKAACRVPLALRDKFTKEIQSMVD